METPPLKVGLFGIGLDVYWEQFAGLEDRLRGYIGEVASGIERSGAAVVNLGLIDTVDKAYEAGRKFKQEDVELIFLYVTTYALSSTVLPVIKKAKVPVIILNLAPEAAIDYATFNKLDDLTKMTGEWLAYCSACPVPEIANVFRRANIPFHQVTGVLHNDPAVWQQIDDWIAAAKVAHVMSYNRLGLMGNYYNGMLDIYSNLTLQSIVFGGHMEIIEVDELSAIRLEVSEDEVKDKLEEFSESFEIIPECSIDELKRAARTSVALDKIVKKYSLGSIAYYHKGAGNPLNADTMSSVIMGTSLLTSNHIPVAGEYEVKNAQAMKIMDSFGAGGSFTEYYAMDFTDDVVLMGHDGPCHPAIAEGRIKVKPLKVYHGKVGSGLSVEMSVKHGPVTLLSVVETGDGKLFFLVAEAASVAGPILEIGNTNSRYRFPISAKNFVEQWNAHGPAHHCAIGVGHIASKIMKLGQLLGIETVKVC
ncbi:arabinose isomerase [uncultured Mucilaginibacter sp.]|uniref:arabinose isomerase n=1 Tax=uncultured Mucilaginibacter sp. TaxID=797541 RepID=UPI0025EDD0FC|nr:arabinose isomerase [uncultured Mucilaginibacter sp.]